VSPTRPAWWQDAVFYQIYPRSFCLADPDGRRRRLGAGSAPPDIVQSGSGDLEGIRRHLDHLVWLGVDAIWLSPFYPSPMKDFGYDVSDYCDVDPLFGTLSDFDRLLAEAHGAGLRVIVDLVPNHTSDRHPWFLDARSSRRSVHRDWYVWRDPDPTDPTRPPNNWLRAFGEGPAWTFDAATGQWYLHLFLPEQPDLNWANPEVVAAMEEVMAFWLRRGVDGFRIDVVHALGKDPEVPDAPAEKASIPWASQNDDERTHPILRGLRSFADSFPHEPVLVGEVFLISTETIAEYYGDGDELHLAFNFPPMFCAFDAECFRRRVSEAHDHLSGHGRCPTWVLSSHDRPRVATRFGGSERRARAAALLLLGLEGAAFLFAGEELGLEDAFVPPEIAVDPGGRDGCRAPIPWVAGPGHGWSLPLGGGGADHDERAWLPFPPAASAHSVEAEMADRSSILWLYRDLLDLRRSEPALRSGTTRLLWGAAGEGTGLPGGTGLPDGVLAIERGDGESRFVVAVNFLDSPVELPLASPAVVAISTRGADAVSEAGQAYAGVLGPEEGVIVRLEP
jgi:alpha-glucosidase